MLCIGPELWNKLPDSMKYVQSLGSFESLLKMLLELKPERLHQSLPFEAARAAVAAFVTLQVDRWNSLLVGSPKCLLDCLQSVLNASVGCCATGENTITLHCSSVMFYAGSQFLFKSSLRSAYWSVSRFMGPRLGICATFVIRRIRPLRVYDFDRRINAIFL